MAYSSMGHVFISYSRKDEKVMRHIVEFLRNNIINVWVDNEKLVPGTPIWEAEIEKAIINANAVIVVLSPDAKDSIWVRREVSYAEESQKFIIPILVRGDERSSVPIRLAAHQRLDMRKNDDDLHLLKKALTGFQRDLEEDKKRLVAQMKAAQRIGRQNPQIMEFLQKILRVMQEIPTLPMTTFVDIYSTNKDSDYAVNTILLEYRRRLSEIFELMHSRKERVPPTIIVAIDLIDSLFGHWVYPAPPTPKTRKEKEIYDELISKIKSHNAIEKLVTLESEFAANGSREELLENIKHEWDATVGPINES